MAKTPILLGSFKGPKGDTGSQGVQGTQGAQGSQGAQGPQGTAGTQGPQGVQGPAGPSSWAGGVYSAGQISGSWSPTPSNGPDQEAVLSADATLNAPGSAGANGQQVKVTFGATGASRVLTFGITSRPAGWPSSAQIPVGGQLWVIIRYSTTYSKWSIVAISQEA